MGPSVKTPIEDCQRDRVVGRGGKIVGSGPIVGIGTTGVLLGGLVGCPGVLVRGGSGVLVGAGGWN